MSVNIFDKFSAAYRAFVVGHAVVSPHEMAWGHDDSKYSPPEYGDYISTSNGVYTCAKLRASMLSGVPLVPYQLRNGEKVAKENGALLELLHKVNPFWTFNRLLEMSELSLCLWGEVFWFLERGQGGRSTPREIWWARPDHVKVVPHPENYIAGFIFTSPHSGEDIPFMPEETIWLRYPNPMDQYSGLSPLSAARLAADTSAAAMKSNRNLFTNGMQPGGFIMPEGSDLYTTDQARELERDLEKRFRGVDKAHKWAVLRFKANIAGSVSPKDAEFAALLKWTLEDIARAYGVPLDLIGGQRTYENISESRRALWTQTLLPEARFIASELTEQLVPMFGREADLVEFDISDIEELHEEENSRWERNEGQIKLGAITINEWRADYGLDPVAWGDEPMRPQSPFGMVADEPQEEQEEPRALVRIAAPQTRAIEFNSEEHQRLWNRHIRRAEPHENEMTRMVVDLFQRQQDSLVEKLKQRRSMKRDAVEDLLGSIFDMARWIRAFRVAVRPIIRRVAEDAGQDALDDIGILLAFDVNEPLVARFLEQRAQRFAERVNDTTWKQLKGSLDEGMKAGEGIDELADRVQDVMQDRIRSSKETIARTEVNGALNGGTIEAWKQSDVVETKTWLAALDERTRGTHINAHGQTVGLDDDFQVGGGRGSAPGQIGLAEEDINCRCSMTAGVRV